MMEEQKAPQVVSIQTKASVSSILARMKSPIRPDFPTSEHSNTTNPNTSTQQQENNTFWHRSFKAPGSVHVVKSPPTSPLSIQPQPAPSTTSTHHIRQNSSDSQHTTTIKPSNPPTQPQSQISQSQQQQLTPSRSMPVLLSSGHSTISASTSEVSGGAKISLELSRQNKFTKALSESVVDINGLKKLCWKGIPKDIRPAAWKLLLGYLPAHSDRREEALERKRKEYHRSVPQFMGTERSETEEITLHQIKIDLPRTAPSVPLFAHPKIRSMMEKILYIWAMLHPASSYVQGINDLVTPIILVFLSEYITVFGSNGLLVETIDIDKLSDINLSNIEADSFWCLTKLLDGIQDNYTNDQPGIVRSLDRLHELIRLIDPQLEQHIENQNAMYVEFSFRWVNCLLLRELPIELIIRIWDTYMSEGNGDGFSVLHLYVCATLLLKWSKEVKAVEMPDLMLFLQHLPTEKWTVSDVEDLLSQAYIYKTLYEGSHYMNKR